MYIKKDYNKFSQRDNFNYLMSEARKNLWGYYSQYPPASTIQSLHADYSNPDTLASSSDVDCLHDMYTLFCTVPNTDYAAQDKDMIDEVVSKNTSLLCDLLNMKGSHTDFIRHEINTCMKENPPDIKEFFSFSENENQIEKTGDINDRQLFVDVFPSASAASYQYVSNLLRSQKEQTGSVSKNPWMNKKMTYMRSALESGCDVSPLKETYLDMNLSQFREVVNGITAHIDVTPYNNPSLSFKQMRKMREDILSGKDLSIYGNEEKKRLFVDMDGTLAKWEDVPYFERLLEKGYFLERPPIENVVDAVKTLYKEHPEIEICILSSCLKESEYAEDEKNAWLDKYLPEIDSAHRFFPAFGADKTKILHGGIRENDYLLDDYSQNLFLFEPPATGIKLLNGINHTHESWRKNALSFDKSGQELADDIFAIMEYDIQIQDKKPQSREKEFSNSPATAKQNPIKEAAHTQSNKPSTPALDQEVEQ